MSEVAILKVDGKTLELPVYEGTENEKGIDISKLRSETGHITLDPGFGNTGPSASSITFLNGGEGILRYRGYEIDELCNKTDFHETTYLVIYGELPTAEQLADFKSKIAKYSRVDEQMLKLFDSLPNDAHPMTMINMGLSALSAYHTDKVDITSEEQVEEATFVALGQILPLVAFAYRKSQGLDFIYPEGEDLSTSTSLLKMMFGNDYKVGPAVEKILEQLLILHADHEFNCSTSAVRLVGSSHANLFASLSAGVSALWGPLHGGANQAVLEMLLKIQEGGGDVHKFIEMAKDKSSSFRLMGFGHRVYKNYDPRARIIKKTCDVFLDEIGAKDELLDIAVKLEKAALADPYFCDRKLYPNVDFYSGLIYRALGIPVEMFTPLFALGRVPGWIAHWREQNADKSARIGRPRQFYTGDTKRSV